MSYTIHVWCSVELRELEAKLKAGYMNKERAAQLAEKEAIRKQEEVKQEPVTLSPLQLNLRSVYTCM